MEFQHTGFTEKEDVQKDVTHNVDFILHSLGFHAANVASKHLLNTVAVNLSGVYFQIMLCCDELMMMMMMPRSIYSPYQL